MIDGVAHGPLAATTTCELYMRHFRDGGTIRVGRWCAVTFPVIKDLVVDRSAFDRIIAAGGFISANTGSAPANTVLVPKHDADAGTDAAACIGCGACVAACLNASASLFTAAKITAFRPVATSQPERARRLLAMVARMDEEGFDNYTCTVSVRPRAPRRSVSIRSRMNGDWLRASLSRKPSHHQPKEPP